MNKYDLVVIGGGPAGYMACLKASKYGKKVLCIEEDKLGGTCLNHGCIPTKTLIKSANIYNSFSTAKNFGVNCENPSFDYQKISGRTKEVSTRIAKGIEFLYKKGNIVSLKGRAKIISEGKIFVEADGASQEIECEKILIATGGKAKRFFSEISADKVMTSFEALQLDSLPKSVIILGAGAIGVEFAYVWNSFGVKVHLVEMRDDVLPNEDDEVSKFLHRCLKKSGIEVHVGAKAESVEDIEEGVRVKLNEKGVETFIEGEKVLLALGVSGRTECVCDSIQVERGFIKVDKNFETTLKNVYAVGDVVGMPLLAHVASFEAVSLIDYLYGGKEIKLQEFYPSCTYCSPEVASIGFTEKAAREKYANVKVSKLPYLAIGKAVAMGETEGFVKLIVNADDKRILGAHIIGAEATELIAEYALAMGLDANIDVLSSIVHGHPTLSESFYELMNQ